MKFSTHKVWYYAIIWSVLWFIGLFWALSFAQLSWINFFFDLPSSLQWGTFPVSFIWWWNNYAGSLIFNSQTSVNQTITFDAGGSVTCRRQIHWYYFNAARWVGLLPLSSQTQMNDGVTVAWWLFTSCWAGARIYDLVGILEYQKNGIDIGKVVFGVQTDLPTNTSNGIYQPWALSWKISNGVNGRFFDTMFGIGDISSASNGIGVIGSVSNLIGTFSNIYIQWHVGIWQSVESVEREILTVNLAGTKTLLTSTDELLSSDIINTVSKNTAKRCRAWSTFTESNIDDLATNNSKFVCIELTNPTFTIDNNNIYLFYNRDIVFLNGNVQLDHTIYLSTAFPDKYLSIYIPNGNLIFDSNIETTDLTDIDNNWFPKNANNTAVTKWVYLVGNFIVNWLVVWSPYNTTSYMSIPFKTFIHGKLVSLNTFTTVSEKREKLLQNLLNTRYPNYYQIATWNTYFPNSRWNASMGDIFAWKCSDISTGWQLQWYGATPIGSFNADTVDAVHSISCPPWHRYPLVIIEKALNSSFFLK